METYIIFGAFLCILAFFYLYYRLTLNQNIIRVLKKYTVDGDRYIMDSGKRTYRINHSISCLWNWNCECESLWNRIDENGRYDIVSFGLNMPLIGCYYHIIKIE